ncbi:MAG: tRNA preQ1(34) S-adenosylmethionine ribosyltransferase-isomerase QueA [Coriobacteriales bacterium]|jgi:S-adenosylmethionine:tRNA ribosyltransferase-isomerase|nr:tRNA preQ1(34) S-adenosylmethionine ribosyltransferase-isomerase QueA [Coriobacteriales bacterium]
MRTESFDYLLPDELIAQSPALPRESCRMLVLQRSTGRLEHRVFSDMPDYVGEGDVLVVNSTKVMPARLTGQKADTGSAAELLLLRQLPSEYVPPHTAPCPYRLAALRTDTAQEQYWEALVKPGRRLKPGSRILFEGLVAEIVDWTSEDGKGSRIVRLTLSDTTGDTPSGSRSIADTLQRLGTLPLPPYIKDYTGDTSLYQTVYACEQNSAAAPTAGLHFSEELLQRVQAQGCGVASVCLEIGLDTFRQIAEEHIDDHLIHSERYTVPEETVQAVVTARQNGGRVIAVGTTAVRALESAAQDTAAPDTLSTGKAPDACTTSDLTDLQRAAHTRCTLRPVSREQTRLYITPGYRFRVVDALLTNFHTPRSTLMVLVAAFAGHTPIMNAYRVALAQRYRFLSFGDAMLLL